jgi:hypothetical protein
MCILCHSELTRPISTRDAFDNTTPSSLIDLNTLIALTTEERHRK